MTWNLTCCWSVRAAIDYSRLSSHLNWPCTWFVLPSLIILLLLSSSLIRVDNRPSKITVYNYLSIPGSNSTLGYNTVRCGQSPSAQPNSSGQIYYFDMPLLEKGSLTSRLLRRVQGTFVCTALEGSIIFASETFTLNCTSHRGTFTGVGLEFIGQVSSKPITGGTDDFAFSNGLVTTTPLSKGQSSVANYEIK
ncbi:hypothetical protein KP509_34G046700 [Ceratopteris richardii]|uniref:Dirigent protein n=1 Tax=Ceratopteris richardii TaxID=49495 RepID=A0A8T2QKU9_CERRI|nr:hypothetical protein KP509_34G046700 [Ceratopteris richardii]